MPSESRVSSSILCSNHISIEVARHYGLGEAVECDLFSHGRRDIYRVRVSDRSYFLKVYEAGTAGRDRVLGEAHALLHLQRCGVSVAYPIACEEGAFCVDVSAPEGTRLAVLYTKAAGEPLSGNLNPASCKAYGELLARMHESLDDYSGAQDPVEYLDVSDALHAISPYMEGRKQSMRLDALSKTIGDAVQIANAALVDSGIRMGICHGDAHDFNVHIDETGALTLFDFEDMHVGWRPYDLATFLLVLVLRSGMRRGMKARSDFERSEMFSYWMSFVSGYDHVRTLTSAEQRAIYAFVPVRRVIEMGWIAKSARVFGSRRCHPNLLNMGFDFIDAWMERYGLSSSEG